MPGARGHLPPALARPQPIDRRFMHRMANVCVKSTCDGTDGRHLSGRCTLEKRGHEWLFFFKRQILMAAPATSWGFKHGRPTSFIARDHRMHKGNRDAKVSCHRRRRSWIHQRRINHRPFLVHPEIDRGTSLPFDFINREVGCSAGDLSHNLLLIQRWSAAPIFYLRMQLRMRSALIIDA
jgi:hypothetical protein